MVTQQLSFRIWVKLNAAASSAIILGMNIDPKPANCVLCDQRTVGGPIERYDQYTLWKCTECAGQFWWPFKNPGHEWYENDVRYHGRNQDPLLTPVATHLLFLEDHPVPGGEVLDVGCGTGNFLASAQKEGYKVSGIDFDRDAIQICKEVFQLSQVRVASIEDVVLESKRYDAITFFEVLEHLDQPREFLHLVRGLLQPNGVIALSVPNAASWDAFKAHDKPPRHLTRWTERSMKTFLETNGFNVERAVQLRLPISLLVTKFRFWTKGLFSFNAVAKAQQKMSSASVAQRSKSWKIITLKFLARVKDTILFGIPACVLWLYLFCKGKATIGLYVLASVKQETDRC